MGNPIIGVLEQRKKLVEDARRMFEERTKDGAPLSAEDEAKYNKMLDDAQALKRQAETYQKAEAEDASIAEAWAKHKDITTDPKRGTAVDSQNEAVAAFSARMREVEGPSADARFVRAYRSLPKAQREALDTLQLEAFEHVIKHGAFTAPDRYRAALNITDVTKGGYFRAPMAFVGGVLKAIDLLMAVRQHATILQDETGEGFGAVSLDANPAVFTWSTEIPAADITEDDTMEFGGRELKPNPFRKLILASKDLADRYPNVVSFLQDRLAYMAAYTMEYGYLLGNGSKQPLGLFTASAHGINTDRDVSTDATGTATTFDHLKEVKHTLRQPYRQDVANCGWLVHPDFVKKVAKLKDGVQQYYWQPSVQAGEPDRLLNHPVWESELCPNTWTSGLYVGIFGNLKYFWIADYASMSIQRLVELYALRNRDGWIASMASDGQPVLNEAFVRVKLG